MSRSILVLTLAVSLSPFALGCDKSSSSGGDVPAASASSTPASGDGKPHDRGERHEREGDGGGHERGPDTH